MKGRFIGYRREHHPPKNPSSQNRLLDLSAHIFPKKRLGQVFLADRNVAKKMISACHLTAADTVLEIGAGLGTLTEAIAGLVKKVIAIETDKRFCLRLSDQFKGRNVAVIQADFLKYDMDTLPSGLIAIGNLPYYISSPIIAKLLKHRKYFASIFITVQLEFGRRMVARPHTKDYSALTCLVQYYAQCQMLFGIKKTSFRPMPKVDSCFMHLALRDEPLFPAADESWLFKIIHHAFQQRRKTILNALNPIIAKDKLSPILDSLKMNPHLRPENLSIKDFVDMANASLS